MPAERKPAHDERLVRRRSLTAPSPEENRDAAGRRCDIQDAAAVSSGVPTGRDDVGAKEHREQAAEDDVRRLEVAVTPPHAPAHACDRCDRECQKSDQGARSTWSTAAPRAIQPSISWRPSESRTGGSDSRGRTGQPHSARQAIIPARPKNSENSQPRVVKPANTGNAAVSASPITQAL